MIETPILDRELSSSHASCPTDQQHANRKVRVPEKFVSLIFFVLLLVIAVRILRLPLIEFGDGREYVLQTQAIVLDHSLTVDPTRRAPYWNETNPYGVVLNPEPAARPSNDAHGESRQFGGGFGALYLDSSGTFRFIHSWVYSMAVAPLYAALHHLGPKGWEYYSFPVTNLLLFFVPLLLLWRKRPGIESLACIVVMLASPITPHLRFAHSEIFCLSSILMSFALLDSTRWRSVSPFFLGIGAAQNIPITLLFPLHVFLFANQEGGVRKVLQRPLMPRVALVYGAAIVPVIGILLYNHNVFGTYNLIAALGQADTRYLSTRRMASVFVSPMIGAAWYLPASWLAVLLAFHRGQWRVAVLSMLSVLAVAALSSTTANINSAQLSACRYAVWYLGPLYVLAFLSDATSSSRRRKVFFWWGTSLVVGCLWWWLGLPVFLKGDSSRFFSTQRAVREVGVMYRLSHFHDDIEPLVENIIGRELRVPFEFQGLCLWNLGKGQSLWILSERALRKAGVIEVRSSDALEDSPGVRELFEISRTSAGNYLLRVQPEIQFNRHPYFGGYRLVWAAAHVDGVRASVPVVVR